MSTAPKEADGLQLERHGLTRREGVVLVIDLVSSVHQIEKDELGTVSRWVEFASRVKRDILPAISGRVVKSLGDGLMIECADPRKAVKAALSARRLSQEADLQLELRIGIEIGEFLANSDDVYGIAVNRAARLMMKANPGQIVISQAVRDRIVDDIDAQLEDLGHEHLRHARDSVRTYAVHDPSMPDFSMTPATVAMAPTLAIMPFRSEPATPDFAALGDILCEALINSYAHSQFMHVIARLSTEKLRGADAPVAVSRDYLRADYLLSGIIHVRGNNAELRVEVNDTRDGDLVIAESLPLSIHDAFAHYRDTLERLRCIVGNAIHMREVAREQQEPLQKISSHSLLMSAINKTHRLTLEDFSEASRILDVLCEREPKHPAPFAWKAHWHHMRIQQGWSASIAADAAGANEACARALDLNPNSSLALAVNGLMAVVMNRRHDLAETMGNHAVAISPNDPRAWLYLGAAYIFSDRGAQAVQAVARASHLSPLDPYRFMYDSIAGSAYFVDRNYQRAYEMSELAYRRNRRHASTLRIRAVSLLRLGRHQEAQAAAAEILQQEPTFTISSWKRRSPASDANSGRDICEAFAALGIPD